MLHISPSCSPFTQPYEFTANCTPSISGNASNLEEELLHTPVPSASPCRPITCKYYNQMLISAEVGKELLLKYNAELDGKAALQELIDAQKSVIESLIEQNKSLISINNRAADDLELTRKQMIHLELYLNDCQIVKERAIQSVDSLVTNKNRHLMSELSDAEMDLYKMQATNIELNTHAKKLHILQAQTLTERDQALDMVVESSKRIQELQAQVFFLSGKSKQTDRKKLLSETQTPALETIFDLQRAYHQLSIEHANLLEKFRAVQDELDSIQEYGHAVSNEGPKTPLNTELDRATSKLGLCTESASQFEMHALLEKTRGFMSKIQSTDPASIQRKELPFDPLISVSKNWDELCVKGHVLLDETMNELLTFLASLATSESGINAWNQLQICVGEMLLEIISLQRKFIETSKAYVSIMDDKDQRIRERAEPPSCVLHSPSSQRSGMPNALFAQSALSTTGVVFHSYLTRSRKLFGVF